MKSGELPPEFETGATWATSLDTAKELVKKALDLEHELQIQVCRIHDYEPHGKRGYKDLTSIPDCVRALNKCEVQIKKYRATIEESNMGLTAFNNTLIDIYGHRDALKALMPEPEPEVIPVVKPRRLFWIFPTKRK